MSLFDNVRGASLSFVSDGDTYTLETPWSAREFFLIPEQQLLIRRLLRPSDWKRWRSKHKKSEDALQLTRDSLSTIGVDGAHAIEFLSALTDDKLFPYVEADLLGAGITLEAILDGSCPLRRAVNAFTALPETSATYAQLGKPYSDWSRAEWMLAELVDLMNFQVQLQHTTAQVSGWKPKSNTKPPKPVFARPAEPEKKKVKMTSTADFVAMLRRQKNGESSP